MYRRKTLFKALAALLAFALLLPTFGAAFAVTDIRLKDEEEPEEPVYDMMAYVSPFRWILFNSSDPTQWEVYKEIDYEDPQWHFDDDNAAAGCLPSAAVSINGEIYMTGYCGISVTDPHYLYKLNENMEPERLGLLTCEQHDVPNNYDGGGPYYMGIFGLTYAEDEDTLYALACCFDETEYIVWGIATIDLETYNVEFVCEWTYMGNENFLGLFWPVTITYAGEGEFYVLEAWTNSIVKLNPETFLEYETICVIPDLVSLYPTGLIETFQPASLYYNAEENWFLCGCSSAYSGDSTLVKMDAETGEVIYDVGLMEEGMPYYNLPWWPLNCFLPYNPPSPIALGDVDGSGEIDVVDALLALRYAMGVITELPYIDKADVDGSGEINAVDALIILRMAMHVI